MTSNCRSHIEKLKILDDKFQRELSVKEKENDLKLRKVVAERDDEVNKARQKV